MIAGEGIAVAPPGEAGDHHHAQGDDDDQQQLIIPPHGDQGYDEPPPVRGEIGCFR